MQTYFDSELEKLRKRIIKMLNLVGSQLDRSFQVLLNSNSDIIETIKHDENKVDKLDNKIDKLCQRIFALAQPVASDLRLIMASLRIGTEMERVGDIAYDITNRSENVSQFADFIKQYDIPELLQQIQKLFDLIIESYTNGNTTLANEIITECKDKEENCRTIFDEIVSSMTEKSDIIIIATDLILILRNLERVLGHIENIAESIIFIVEGKSVKHSGLRSKK